MSQVHGYWFNTATGEVRDVTVSRHITELISTPEAFGLTIGIIKEAYERYGEIMGVEAKARVELIKWVVSTTDWVRIREYEEKSAYYVTANARSPEQRPIIEARFPQFAGHWNWQ